MAKTWNKKELDKAVELRNQGYTSNQISRAFGGKYSAAAVRRKLKRSGKPISTASETKDETYNNDGVQTSSVILTVTKGKKLTPEEILKAHNLDPTKWRLVSNISNAWKQSENTTSFQSKITVKPILDVDPQTIVNIFNENIKPIKVSNQKSGKDNLVVPLYDLHMGIMTFDLYREQIRQIKEVMSRGYNRIVFEQGGDLLHSDKINSSQTVKGTELDEVDMVQAIKDAKAMFDELMICALVNSKQVDVYAIGGNHDFDLSYMFMDALADRFPDVTVHNTNKYRQTYQIDKVGIMLAHGDRFMKKLPMLFATEEPVIWSTSEYREIHYGHWHKEITNDDYGVVTRQLGTPKLNDPYEKSNGFTMATHKLQLFEYGIDRLKATYEIKA